MSQSPQGRRASPETREEAERIARANQRPGQTKEQTRLIAQGIQKGIDEYKKQHKAKARELDRERKKAKAQQQRAPEPETRVERVLERRANPLPWVLLALTWAGILLFLVVGL